ncbi:MAG: flagellar basal body P-ring protein FlgI [Thermoguttaceae bacterium]|nr:flagellar basal body P-ring protein FlgI [Thermoguttaceae bacterium]MDW8079694.1 flagellar basal body P-ring protein FlgI [Thermoguttaceae bacterium]
MSHRFSIRLSTALPEPSLFSERVSGYRAALSGLPAAGRKKDPLPFSRKKCGTRAALLLLILLSGALGAGCSYLPLGKISREQLTQASFEPKAIPLVGDFAVPYGLHPVTIEGIGLVTGLRGMGGDPRPSGYRQALLAEMRARGVVDPESVLASPDTALVLVRGVLPPGIQAGDRFDVEVRVPAQDEVTSLRGGWLLETELKEFAVLSDNQVHSGHVMGKASGPIMTDPFAHTKKDSVLTVRGWILGGGVSKISRPLLLVLRPQHQSVANSARIESAINRRFHVYDRGNKLGVAKAKTDEYLEVRIHPRYRNNIPRYARVLCAVALRDSETIRQERLAKLETQLQDPNQSAEAALQLEAIGRECIPLLKKYLNHPNITVRFRVAEALAYLDDNDAAKPLAQIARDEPAFRALALAALSAMDDAVAAQELVELLNCPSAETRYGAFRALTAMPFRHPVAQGEVLNDQFRFHVLDTSGPPMVHIARSRQAEIVLFGRNQRLRGPVSLEAGKDILIVCRKPGEVTVSRFAVGEPDQRRVVSDRLEEVIRAIAELGGTYPDVVQALQEAQAAGALEGRLEIDALPQVGRRPRTNPQAGQAAEAQVGTPAAGQPAPSEGAPTDSTEEAEALPLFNNTPAGDEEQSPTSSPELNNLSATEPGGDPTQPWYKRLFGRN